MFLAFGRVAQDGTFEHTGVCAKAAGVAFLQHFDDPLLRLDNVTVVPHVASATRSTRLKMAMMCVENVIAGIQGDAPPYCVNPEALKNRRP